MQKITGKFGFSETAITPMKVKYKYMRLCAVLFFTIIFINASAQNSSGQLSKPAYLPSRFENGRFYLKIPALNGDTILGFCDTGGGYTAIYGSTLKKINAESKIAETKIDGEKTRYILAMDVFSPVDIPGLQMASYMSSIKSPFFEVPPDDDETAFFLKYVPHDAFLGQFFFINHAWTFDYTAGKIFINTPISRNLKDENVQPLGFKKDKAGKKEFGHASMKITVDGQIIDVLFDTGASFLLSDSGATAFDNKNSTGGSFIAKTIFDTWHQQHPDWRVIKKGEITGADLIEVPQIKIGNLAAGPVWFSKRPDEAWSKGMIGSMDKVVKGAIGGSLLQYFKVVIDYNSELIKFEIKK